MPKRVARDDVDFERAQKKTLRDPPRDPLVERMIKKYVKAQATLEELSALYHILPEYLEPINKQTEAYKKAVANKDDPEEAKATKRTLILELRAAIYASISSFNGDTLINFDNDTDNLINGLVSFDRFYAVYGFNLETLDRFLQKNLTMSRQSRNTTLLKPKFCIKNSCS